MSRTHSRLTRALSAVASAALVLSGISLIAAVPANAAPVVQTVTGNDIRSIEPLVYEGWHEGYSTNTTRQYFIDSNGLHLGINSPSQILNGTAPVSATIGELQNIILSSALDVVSGPATFQLPLWFGPGNPQNYTTLRSTSPTAGTNAWTTTSNWESSANIPNTGTVVIPKNTPTALSDILAALGTQGSLRLLGFGVQASSLAVVSGLTYGGAEYQFRPFVAAAPTNSPVVVRNVDLLGPEQDDPNASGFNYESWHEGKSVKTSSVESDGLHFGSSTGSTTIKGTTVKTHPNDNTKTQSQLQALIAGASFTLTSGSVNFQVPVNFGAGLSNFTTLLSQNYTAAGTHTFALTDLWSSSHAIGPYGAFQPVALGDLLDTVYSLGAGQVWLAGFGVQSNTASIVPSVVWNGTEYQFHQPVTQACLSVANGPTATNQNSQGWTFGQTRAQGHNEFTADGLHVWTEGAAGSPDPRKAAGYKAVNFPLADVGSVPVINMINTVGSVPSVQLGVSFDGNGTQDAYLVNEATAYPNNANDWWSTSNTFAGPHPTSIFGHPAGTLDEWLVLYPDAKVVSVGYSLGSGVQGEITITSIVAGCTSYGFTANDTYATPTTVNVNDSEIFPIENVIGWGDGYGHTPRSYSTLSDGAHIADGYKTQLFQTFATPLTMTGLESLITGASVSVGSGSTTYQVAIRYGNANTFTTLRSNSLTAPSNHFSVTDKWVSTRALVDNVNGTVTTTNYEAPIADLVAFFNSQGNVRVLGMGAQADSPAVVQDVVFNGIEYHFVSTAADTAGQADVRVTQPEIDLNEASDGSNYTNWHQGYPGQEADPTFAVGESGLILTPGNDPVTPRSQILNGLTTPVAGAGLYALLTSHAGITVGTGGDVTYQVPVTFTGGWSTLRSASLSTGAHTFSLSDLWISSKAIGGTITAGAQYPLGDILDAMNAQGAAEAIGFGVQSQVDSLVTDITWGNTRYYFDGAIVAATPTITGGSTFGDTLTAHPGIWTPSNVTLSYQWNENGAPISGANTGTYVPTAAQVGKTITVTVTGSAANYTSASSTSLGVTIAAAALTTAVPTISGTPLVGQTLTATAGAWATGTVVLTYKWYADNVALPGATGPTYMLTGAENGKTITVKVTGTLAGYTTASETSAGYGPIGLPSIVAGTPTITGSAMVGTTLTAGANASTWTPASGLTFTYVWNANGSPISGATSSTYTLTAADLGKTFSVTVSGAKTGYVSALATSGGVTVINGTIVVSRLAGDNRYETAVKISQQWTAATKVYIADGLGYADALSAGPAAAHFNAPLLLTAPGLLPPVVVTELNRLHPTEIVIVGGAGVVSSAVESALNALSFHPLVTRVAGIDRYATSRALAINTWGAGSLGTAYLATGADFPDALSAAPAAAHFDGPVVLIPGKANSIDTATQNVLTYLGVDKIKIAGGTGVVSAAIETQVRTIFGPAKVTRNGGIDRYATSVAINADEFTSASTVYLAQGLGFPDALAGAAIAGNNHAPLFVSQATCIPQSVLDAISHLGATSVVLLGGTGVLSPAVGSLTSCGPTS